jgi:hypothetical protein
MSDPTEHASGLWQELELLHRPPHYDNSALRARLAGAKVEDRPIVIELHKVMAERDAFAELPQKG